MKSKFEILALAFLLPAIIVPAACRKKESALEPEPEIVRSKKWDRDRAELEYKLIQTEMRLARTDKPYLVINIPARELDIRLRGARVWNHHLDFAGEDPAQLDEFADKFLAGRNRLVRPMTQKHLFAATDKTPDSILAIVGEVVNVDPSLLQREIPERFMISWGPNLSLVIQTEIAGQPMSRFKNTFVEFRQVLQLPFGATRVATWMSAEEAITLYRFSHTGLPTLIYPSL
jgi:hypothetical protein